MRIPSPRVDGSKAVSVAATPIDLARILDIRLPVVRVRYDYADHGAPYLGDIVDRWLGETGLAAGGTGAG